MRSGGGSVWLWPWIGWAVAVSLSLLVLGPVMHESDQASLVSGMTALANGEASVVGATFYNYDKQYGSYWLLAGLRKLMPFGDPVLLGNLAGITVFWGGAALLLLRWPPRTTGQSWAATALWLTPAFLQHSPFLASNFLAAGLLMASAAAWSSVTLWSRLLSVGLAGVATACRADVLAVLPLLTWVLLPRRKLATWLRQPWLWAFAAGGLVAWVIGKTVAGASSRLFYDPFFVPQIFAAYTVFGIGGTLFLLAGWEGSCLTQALRRPGWTRRWHALAGAAVLGPIFLFYSLQMFSTRHWVTGLTALGLLALHRRGAVCFGGRSGRVWATLALIAALVGLGVGVRLPFPDRPSLVFGAGTAFPTADGEQTMGGYAWRLWEMRTSGFAHDHNHPLWQAVRDADYLAETDGRVAVATSGMHAYFELALRLRGLGYRRIADADVANEKAGFHVDSRSLLRDSPTLGSAQSVTGYTWIDGRNFVPVSSPTGDIVVLRAEPGETPDWLLRRAALARAFGGDEFLELADWEELADYPGHTAVIFHPDWRGDPAAEPFVADRGMLLPGPSAFVAGARSVPRLLQELEAHPGPWRAAVSRLPAYMSVGQMRGE